MDEGNICGAIVLGLLVLALCTYFTIPATQRAGSTQENKTSGDVQVQKKSKKKKPKQKKKGKGKNLEQEPTAAEGNEERDIQAGEESCKIPSKDRNATKVLSSTPAKLSKPQVTVQSGGNVSNPLEASSNVTEHDNSDSESDSDLSAAQILQRRKFKTTSVGRYKVKKSTTVSFGIGERVEARFQCGDEWFPGTISKVQRGNFYGIEYDDGEKETKVSVSYIRPVGNKAPTVKAQEVDAAVESDDSDQYLFEKPDEADDGWEVVSTKVKKIKDPNKPRFDADTGEEILTKKQRESRRRKERLKEKKAMEREQSQNKGLHAVWGGTRNKWRETSSK